MSNQYFLRLTAEEALLIDRILTLHSWDEQVLGYLMQERIGAIRLNAGKVLIGKAETFYIESNDTLDWLLCVIPGTFYFGENDVGNSLKKKLYRARLGIEEKNEDSGSPSKRAWDENIA